MSVAIDKAIKTRWNARSLTTYITGGIHHSRSPENTSMPYCIFEEISDAVEFRTKVSRYNRKLVQFDVYNTTPDSVGALIERIVDAFDNSERAPTNALSVATSVGVIKSATVDANPTIIHEADGVYRATFTLAIEYSVSRNLIPSA